MEDLIGYIAWFIIVIAIAVSSSGKKSGKKKGGLSSLADLAEMLDSNLKKLETAERQPIITVRSSQQTKFAQNSKNSRVKLTDYDRKLKERKKQKEPKFAGANGSSPKIDLSSGTPEIQKPIAPKKKTLPVFLKQNLVSAIIMSEVLGKPVAEKY